MGGPCPSGSSFSMLTCTKVKAPVLLYGVGKDGHELYVFSLHTGLAWKVTLNSWPTMGEVGHVIHDFARINRGGRLGFCGTALQSLQRH